MNDVRGYNSKGEHKIMEIDGNFKAFEIGTTKHVNLQDTSKDSGKDITLNFNGFKTSGKKITNDDLENVLMQSSGIKAVRTLLDKSPVGKTFPEAGELMKNGYSPAYMTDAKGSKFYQGDGGTIRISKQEGEERTGLAGDSLVQYTTGKYEQNVIYDKDGNIKQGTIVIRDDFGNIEKQYDFIIEDNGRTMSVIQ